MAAGTIRVVVRGPLWASLLAALSEYSVKTDADGLTSIVGTVRNQAELLDLLDRFDGLHVELISVSVRRRRRRSVHRS